MTQLELERLLFIRKLAKKQRMLFEISLDYVVRNEFGNLILFNNNTRNYTAQCSAQHELWRPEGWAGLPSASVMERPS